jgi:hypothetical protein
VPVPASLPLKEVTNASTAVFSKPVNSYIDIAFKNLLESTKSDKEKWEALPPVVQKDALRHVWHLGIKGEAESLARRIYKDSKIFELARKQELLQNPNTGLNQSFMDKGQELLDFRYSDAGARNYHKFLQRFNELPKELRFYQYVYEMAKANGVKIEDWDHDYAKYNWNKEKILPLALQALERCLHTS